MLELKTNDELLHPGDAAPDVELRDDADRAVRLNDLWQARPLALFFVRHSGCPFCREHVQEVRDDYARFQAAGGEVAVVTMCSSPQAAEFRRLLELPFACLADPQQAAYQAFRIPRGNLAQIAGPSVWGAGVKAVLRGGIGRIIGDPRQLPGSFIIDPKGIIRFTHYPKDQADRPNHEEMIGVLEGLGDDKSS